MPCRTHAVIHLPLYNMMTKVCVYLCRQRVPRDYSIFRDYTHSLSIFFFFIFRSRTDRFVLPGSRELKHCHYVALRRESYVTTPLRRFTRVYSYANIAHRLFTLALESSDRYIYDSTLFLMLAYAFTWQCKLLLYCRSSYIFSVFSHAIILLALLHPMIYKWISF